MIKKFIVSSILILILTLTGIPLLLSLIAKLVNFGCEITNTKEIIINFTDMTLNDYISNYLSLLYIVVSAILSYMIYNLTHKATFGEPELEVYIDDKLILVCKENLLHVPMTIINTGKKVGIIKKSKIYWDDAELVWETFCNDEKTNWEKGPRIKPLAVFDSNSISQTITYRLIEGKQNLEKIINTSVKLKIEFYHSDNKKIVKIINLKKLDVMDTYSLSKKSQGENFILKTNEIR